MAKQKNDSKELQIVRVNKGQIIFCILGTTPLILNRMSEKAKRQLLCPSNKRKSQSGTLKHEPYQEFLASPYIDQDKTGPTHLQYLASAFKGALREAAVDVDGSSKAEIGRLCWVEGERVPIYGVPQLQMTVVRSSDINRTPDIRTRTIIPKWATTITISYIKPMLNDTSITNLLVLAGIAQGVGDWRTGKGKGTYGSFEIVSKDNPSYQHLIKHGGRKVQEAAMKDPGFYDHESEELYRWFEDEVTRRGVDRNGADDKGKTYNRLVSELQSVDEDE